VGYHFDLFAIWGLKLLARMGTETTFLDLSAHSGAFDCPRHSDIALKVDVPFNFYDLSSIPLLIMHE